MLKPLGSNSIISLLQAVTRQKITVTDPTASPPYQNKFLLAARPEIFIYHFPHLLTVAGVQDQDDTELWLAISEDGVSLLDHTSMQVKKRHPYTAVVTFGGCQEDFMLVVTNEERTSRNSSATEKHLFSTTKPKVTQQRML